MGNQKDLDPRVPNEFTKRGFYVAAIDYRGDGESGRQLLDINPNSYRNRTDVPAIAQDCSKLSRHSLRLMINLISILFFK